MLYLHSISGRLPVYQNLSLLSNDLCHIVQLSNEKGASSWLSVLSIKEHGFTLHKGAFRDALCLRYMVDYLVAFLLSVSVVMALLLIMQ